MVKMNDECHSLCLARFFFVVGHIAMKLLVYTKSLSGSIQRANATKSLKKQELADKAKEKKKVAKQKNKRCGSEKAEKEKEGG
jgi:condensin complex subunit 1